MKTAFIVVALASAFSLPAVAANHHGSHGAAHAAAPAGDAQMVDGTVKKIDKSAGKLTLAHGPLPNLGMNMNMTMVFRVKDVAWLDQMKEGDKIRFVADKVNGAFTVVAFEPAK